MYIWHKIELTIVKKTANSLEFSLTWIFFAFYLYYKDQKYKNFLTQIEVSVPLLPNLLYMSYIREKKRYDSDT